MKKQPKPRCAKCKVNQAALDDAQKQFQEVAGALTRADLYCDRYRVENMVLELAAELNMSAYEDAQMHARTNHQLLTEALEKIENLQLTLGDYKSACAAKQEQIEGARAELQRQILDYNKLWQDRADEVAALEFDLQHADMVRRQAERDRDHYKAQMDLQGEKLIEQQTQLKRWGRFDVVSSRLEGDHA